MAAPHLHIPVPGYFSAVASGAAWLSGAAKPVVKALRKTLGRRHRGGWGLLVGTSIPVGWLMNPFSSIFHRFFIDFNDEILYL
jgi:hypothetical protein